MADVELYKRMYEVYKAAFDEEMERVEFYDRKAQIVFGVSGVVLAFMVGRLDSVVSTLKADLLLPWLIFTFYVLSDVALCVSLMLAVNAITFRNYHTYPDSKQILDTFKTEKEIDLLASMAHHFAETTKINEISNRLRASFLNRSVRSLRVAIVLVLLFIGSYVWSSIYAFATSRPNLAKEVDMSEKSEPAKNAPEAGKTQEPKVIPMTPREVQKGLDDPPQESLLEK